MTTDSWLSRTESSSAGVLDAREDPRIIGVVPIVRWARLIKHEPHLTEADTLNAAEAMNAAWPTWKNTYREFVAEKAGLSPEDFFFAIEKEKDVRWKMDVKTPMLDVPRLRTEHLPTPFDLRLCCALCVDEFSSKIWARVGRPFDGVTSAVPVEEMRSLVERFRRLAAEYGEWFYAQFTKLTHDVFSQFEKTETGAFEITTVGLRVENELDDHEFDSWLLQYDKEGIVRPNFENETLCRFLMDAANLDFHPRDLKRAESKAFWMTMPFPVELPNGDLAQRKVLYMVRPRSDDFVQVIGVGVDDSRLGDLAKEVTLKVSRFIASRV